MILFLLVLVLIVASITLTYAHVKTLSTKIEALEIQFEALRKKLEEKTIN